MRGRRGGNSSPHDSGRQALSTIPAWLRRARERVERALDSGEVRGDVLHWRGYAIPVDLVHLTGAGPELFAEVARRHMRQLRRHVPIAPHHHVLDVGCGVGRDAIALTRTVVPPGSYLGVDVIGRSIAWCAANVTPRHPHFRFAHFDVRDALHNPGGTLAPDAVRFPAADGSIDRIFLHSVFTHMLEPGLTLYLREFRRLLAPGGLVMATMFLLDEQILASVRELAPTRFKLRFAHDFGPGCYINDPAFPTGAVAYTEAALARMLQAGGMRLARPIAYGSWSGTRTGVSVQDIVVLDPGR